MGDRRKNHQSPEGRQIVDRTKSLQKDGDVGSRRRMSAEDITNKSPPLEKKFDEFVMSSPMKGDGELLMMGSPTRAIRENSGGQHPPPQKQQKIASETQKAQKLWPLPKGPEPILKESSGNEASKAELFGQGYQELSSVMCGKWEGGRGFVNLLGNEVLEDILAKSMERKSKLLDRMEDLSQFEFEKKFDEIEPGTMGFYEHQSMLMDQALAMDREDNVSFDLTGALGRFPKRNHSQWNLQENTVKNGFLFLLPVAKCIMAPLDILHKVQERREASKKRSCPSTMRPTRKIRRSGKAFKGVSFAIDDDPTRDFTCGETMTKSVTFADLTMPPSTAKKQRRGGVQRIPTGEKDNSTLRTPREHWREDDQNERAKRTPRGNDFIGCAKQAGLMTERNLQTISRGMGTRSATRFSSFPLSSFGLSGLYNSVTVASGLEDQKSLEWDSPDNFTTKTMRLEPVSREYEFIVSTDGRSQELWTDDMCFNDEIINPDLENNFIRLWALQLAEKVSINPAKEMKIVSDYGAYGVNFRWCDTSTEDYFDTNTVACLLLETSLNGRRRARAAAIHLGRMTGNTLIAYDVTIKTSKSYSLRNNNFKFSLMPAKRSTMPMQGCKVHVLLIQPLYVEFNSLSTLCGSKFCRMMYKIFPFVTMNQMAKLHKNMEESLAVFNVLTPCTPSQRRGNTCF